MKKNSLKKIPQVSFVLAFSFITLIACSSDSVDDDSHNRNPISNEALHRESVQSEAAYAKVVPSEEVAEDRPRQRPSGTRRSVASCSSSRSTNSRASRVAVLPLFLSRLL